MTEKLEREVQAIKTILEALEPLPPEVRGNVLDYVTKRLKIVIVAALPASSQEGLPIDALQANVLPLPGSLHIEKFKDEKQPKSANEMAAIVAYYLANLAPLQQRKATVNTKDIDTQFKIAKFPLPKELRVTLQNARNAGYFDSVGDGEYKLNAVGQNLVAHNLPRAAAAPRRKTRVGAKKTKAKARARKARRS